jgi:hypothetical protein
MQAGGSRIFRIVGGVFTPIGLALLAAAGWTGNRQYTILKSWPTVEAEVTRSEVARSLSHDSESNRSTYMYKAQIEFRYTLNGKEYLTPSDPGYSTSSYPEMKRLANRFAPGTRHPIKYNPADPNDIRFNAGFSFGFFLLPIILGGMGLVFSLLGIVFLVVSRSGVSLQCPSCGARVEPGQNFCPNCATALPTSTGGA